MESMWFETPIEKRNVSTAGEISRKIDSKAKTFLKFTKSASKSSDEDDTVDIDIIQF